MYIGPLAKYLLCSSYFNKCLIFPAYLPKILKTNFMKTRPLAAELFRADGQTDGLTDRHNDANCPLSHIL
jgi:hypothetical protein